MLKWWPFLPMDSCKPQSDIGTLRWLHFRMNSYSCDFALRWLPIQLTLHSGDFTLNWFLTKRAYCCSDIGTLRWLHICMNSYSCNFTIRWLHIQMTLHSGDFARRYFKLKGHIVAFGCGSYCDALHDWKRNGRHRVVTRQWVWQWLQVLLPCFGNGSHRCKICTHKHTHTVHSQQTTCPKTGQICLVKDILSKEMTCSLQHSTRGPWAPAYTTSGLYLCYPF